MRNTTDIIMVITCYVMYTQLPRIILSLITRPSIGAYRQRTYTHSVEINREVRS